MKKHFIPFIVVIVTLVFTGCHGQDGDKAHSHDEAIEHDHEQMHEYGTIAGQDSVLMQMEIDWSQTVITKDYEMLEEMLAEDLVYHTEEGDVLNRQEYLDAFILNKRNIQTVEVDNMKVTFFQDMIAVVTGTSKEIGKNEDGSTTEYSGLWTNVWLRRDGKWKCIAGHGNTKLIK